MQRACLQAVIGAQYAGKKPPPVRASIAAVYAAEHADGSDAFRAGYQAACAQLLRGLGAPRGTRLADPSAFAKERVGFAVTEHQAVRPVDMKTQVSPLTDGTSRTDCHLQGTKAFLAEDATELLVIARPVGEIAKLAQGVATIAQPGTTLPPKEQPQLVLCLTSMRHHTFTQHPKPLPFLKGLGPQGSAALDGPATLVTTGFSAEGQLVDGTAALLGFRDVEDMHIAAAFASHVARIVLSQTADGTPAAADRLNPSDARIEAAERLRSAAVEVASVVDDAWNECDSLKGAGARGGFPVMFSPSARVHARAALMGVREAVQRAVAVEGGIPAELCRDAECLAIAQKVRDARWRVAMRELGVAAPATPSS